MQLERTFAVINSEAGLQVPPLPCNAPAAIDLDTPPQAEAALDERDLHDRRLQEQQAAEEEEEERLLEMVKEFEEQQRARHAQEQVDKAMAEALAEKVDKRRRLKARRQTFTLSSPESQLKGKNLLWKTRHR